MNSELYRFGGAHLDGANAKFAVWAPNAKAVTLTLNDEALELERDGEWFVGNFPANEGDRYHLLVRKPDGSTQVKLDPFARHFVDPSGPTATIAAEQYRPWSARTRSASPLSVYELHLGSWRRDAEGFLNYEEIGQQLIPYVLDLGFTHVELLPVTEHPFYASWGYQTLGHFAPSSRYGTPAQFARLVERLQDAGIGVILDFVPSHFPTDAWGLNQFDGTALFEHPDPRRGFHPDWNSAIFNYDDPRVREFLVSSACYWFDAFGIDGIRVDAVASMLYLDYSRNDGEWLPNEYGGDENLGAITFLKELNQTIHARFPGAFTIAEESTAWPGVTDPDGLGFDYKWDMGWMHDTLVYFAKDPIYRQHHHRDVTFRAMYAHTERFVLALSHDEVVHAKGSLFGKMAGASDEEKLRHAELLMAYMYAVPGAKHLFMGMEFAQRKEWNHDDQLSWELLENDLHRSVQDVVRQLNGLYRDEPIFSDSDFDTERFQWIRVDDRESSVLIFARNGESSWVFAFNFTPTDRPDFRIGVPHAGTWSTRFEINMPTISYDSDPVSADLADHSILLHLNGLSAIFLESRPDKF